ncbi:MAG: Isopentenyldiphosphate isomerase [uncultured bacterium]|nr:MAG: Isopentenyldiphosphate isomerase [uncultured bacterium]
MEEYLDIVDENGNLTGEKELRSVCHEKGFTHRVAVVYFYRIKNNSIKLLVHLRSKFKEQNPDKWALRFGGHVESGSTIEETIIKEIKEEVGFNISLNHLIEGERSFHDALENREVAYHYYFNFNDNMSVLSFDDGEVQKVKWMNFKEIERSIENNPEIWAVSKEGFLNRKINLIKKVSPSM